MHTFFVSMSGRGGGASPSAGGSMGTGCSTYCVMRSMLRPGTNSALLLPSPAVEGSAYAPVVRMRASHHSTSGMGSSSASGSFSTYRRAATWRLRLMNMLR